MLSHAKPKCIEEKPAISFLNIVEFLFLCGFFPFKGFSRKNLVPHVNSVESPVVD